MSLFKKYKSTYYQSCKDLLKHTFAYSVSLFYMWNFRNSYISILTIPLVSLMIIKTFVIFHDCGHNSYTPNKKLNYILGSILGIFCLTPYCWHYVHNQHHLTSGNKENELHHSYNETVYITFKEYRDMQWKRHIYRLLMNPVIFFTIIPSLKFFVMNRGSEIFYKYFNYLHKPSMKLILFDTILNNSGLLLLLYYINKYGILYHYIYSNMIAFTIGMILFHNQHTYNPPYVTNNEKWNKRDSGLKGSSFIQIPQFLKFFTSGIEYHHIHHINASIPGYNIKKLHEEIINTTDEFNTITCLSMSECYNNIWLSLYDEDNNKYISFTDAESKI